ncbi:MAG: M56 family metallopeptidase [Bacteroidota bacterium]
MEIITDWASTALVEAIGWTVLHSFWQAALLALGLGIAQFFLQHRSANVRYWMGMSALGILVLSSIITFSWAYQWRLESPLLTQEWEGGILILEGDGLVQSNWWTLFANYFDQHIPLIVSVWMLGVLFFLLRSLGGLAYVHHLKTRYVQTVDPSLQARMEALAREIGLDRKIDLVESALVRVPMVIGYLKPMILLPAGAMLSLSPQQLEAVLVHELAHIRRNDYLLNIFQTFVEVVYYFNPSVWWLSSFIRAERENCCDDLAIQICGNSLDYAKALVQLQEMAGSAPSMAVAATGTKKQLLKRVQRILNQPKSSSNIMEKLVITTLLLLFFLGFTFATTTPEEDNSWLEEAPYDEWIIEEETEPELRWGEENLDTIPVQKRRMHVIKESGNESIELIVEQETVQTLKINGEDIPAEEMDQYEALIADLLEEATPPVPPAPPVPMVVPGVVAPPVPPAPPAPMVVPGVVAPPAPPAPVAPTVVPGVVAPPMPPAPPAPPAPGSFSNTPVFKKAKVHSPYFGQKINKQPIRVITEENADGTVVIRVLPEGEEEIAIELGELTGEIKIEGASLQGNEELIILKEEALNWVNAQGAVLEFTEPFELAANALGQQALTISMAEEDWKPLIEMSEEQEALQRELRFQAEFIRDQVAVLEREAQAAAIKGDIEKMELLLEQQHAFEEALADRRSDLAELRMEALAELASLRALNGLTFTTDPDPEKVEILEVLRTELKKDGLIKNDKFTFELDSKRLKINGKKQPDAVFVKYKTLCESMFAKNKGEPVHVSVMHKKNKKKNKSYVSISH